MKEKNKIYVETFGGRNSSQQYVRDCVTRAMAIAFDIDYKVMYNRLYDRARHYAKYGNSVVATYLRRYPRKQSPRNGMYSVIYGYWMKKLGFVKIKFTAKSYLDRLTFDQIFIKCLPKGTYIFQIEKRKGAKRNGHLVCVKDNVVYDSWKCHKCNYKIITMWTTKELGYNFNDKLDANIDELHKQVVIN